VVAKYSVTNRTKKPALQAVAINRDRRRSRFIVFADGANGTDWNAAHDSIELCISILKRTRSNFATWRIAQSISWSSITPNSRPCL